MSFTQRPPIEIWQPKTTFLPSITQTSASNSSTTNPAPINPLPQQTTIPPLSSGTQNCSYIISSTPPEYSHAVYSTLIQPCHEYAPANLVSTTISPSAPSGDHHLIYTYLWAVGLAIIAVCLIACGIWRLAKSAIIYHVAQRKCIQARKHQAVEDYVMADLEDQTPKPQPDQKPFHHLKERGGQSGDQTVRHVVAPSNDHSGLFSGWRRGAPPRDELGSSKLAQQGSDDMDTDTGRQGSRSGESLGSEFSWSQVFGSAFLRGRVVARSRN